MEKVYLDIFGREVKEDDVLLYCSPFDGLHALIVTGRDSDGTLLVSRLKSDGLEEGEEWLPVFDAPSLPFTKEELKSSARLRRFVRMAGTIENIKASRRCYPITLFSGYLIMKKLNPVIRVKGC